MDDQLPSGWDRAHVAELATVLQYGSSAKTQEEPDGVPVLRMGNIVGGQLDLSNLKYLPTTHGEFPGLLLEPGDVLFNRTNSPELVGKTAVYSARHPAPCSFASYLIRVRLEHYEPQLFATYLNSRHGRAWVRSCVSQQVGQANVSGGKLRELELPVPPLAEQKRIVAKVEELTARSRRAKEALDAVPPLLDQLRQSILAAAFRGDLTAAWRAKNPNVEPADKLLAHIRAERRSSWETSYVAKRAGQDGAISGDKWKERYKDAEAVDASELELPPLPSSWRWVTLGHLAWSVKDGPHFSPKYEEAGIPFISGRNVRPDGVDFEGAKFISPGLHAELAQRCLPERGDVLYTKGGTTGIARVNTYEHAFNVWVHVAVLKVVPSIEPFFLQHALNSPFCYAQAQAFTHGVGNQDLGLTRMVRIVLPLAPPAEQQEVIRRVDAAMTAIARMSESLDGAGDEVSRLEQSILAKAFRGELVPQNPNDEPASVLLDRVRAARDSERGEAPGSPRRSRKAERVMKAPSEDDLESEVLSGRLDSAGIASDDLGEIDPTFLQGEVSAALWRLGALEKDDAVRRVADHLRRGGYVRFERLRTDGPLFTQVLAAIDAAVKAGRLDRPKRGHVRVCKPEATTYIPEDWRQALVASLGPEPVDRDDAIRSAAEWARDNMGLEFARLREDGHIVAGLRSAINSAIRRGEVTRYDAKRICRAAPESAVAGSG